MAWELLPVDYTDAVWSGLKRFNQIENQDGTVSFEDVTVYSQKEKSFFGARDANRMNEALNTLMSMVEQGTDLYEAFQIYFNTQKTLFENASNEDLEAFSIYLDNLRATANADVGALKNKYTQEMTAFEKQQEALFTTWFDLIKGQLGTDPAGHLQNEIDILLQHIKNLAVKVHITDTVGTTDPVVITNLTTGTVYRMTDFTEPLYLTEAGTYRLTSSNENYFVAPAVMTIDHTDVMTDKQFRLVDGGGLAFVNGYVGSYVNH